MFIALKSAQRDDLDGRTALQDMLANLHTRNCFFQVMLGDNEVVEGLYFSTPENTNHPRQYHKVVELDATYGTNHAGYPLVEIVVPTCFGTTKTIALAYVKNEKRSTYDWVICLLSLYACIGQIFLFL